MCVTIVGLRRGYGNVFFRPWQTTLSLTICWLTGAAFEYISMAQQKNQQASEAEATLGGRLSTKIQAAVAALGNPVGFILTPGQASE